MRSKINTAAKQRLAMLRAFLFSKVGEIVHLTYNRYFAI